MTAELRKIDGSTARDAAANECLTEFAKETEELSKSVDRMSGFVIICLDDEGFPTSSVHFGQRFPVPPVMLPEIVKEAVLAHVYTRNA